MVALQDSLLQLHSSVCQGSETCNNEIHVIHVSPSGTETSLDITCPVAVGSKKGGRSIRMPTHLGGAKLR
jgi:hypothetical protein